MSEGTRTSDEVQQQEVEGIYLFCFARRNLLPDVAGPGPEDRNPLFQLAFKDVVAVLSRVPLEEFCGPAAEARLQDLTWVGPRACRHEAVIEQMMRRSPVFPARFGALFSSLERLERLMETHYDTISEFLDYTADKEEWGVKGLLDRARAEGYLLASASRSSTPPSSPGARYLLERRRWAEADKQLKSWVKAAVASIAQDLQHRAVGSRSLKTLPHVPERGRDVVFNGAFLVLRSVRGDFCDQVEQLSAEHFDRGLSLGLSGPWPPYNFSPSLEYDQGAGSSA